MKKKMFSMGGVAALITLGLLVAPKNEAVAGVKWYPGHYVQPLAGSMNANSFVMDDTYAEMNQPDSGIKGIQIRLTWKELEPSLNNYEFGLIDSHLSRLKNDNKGKRLFIFIHYKGDDPKGVLPEDLPNNGRYTFNAAYSNETVEGASFWVDSVRNRFMNLVKALGNRYNSDSHFIGVILPETALGGIPNSQVNAYFNSIIAINQEMRSSFPNTVTIQFVNYPPHMLSTLTTSLKNMGGGIGGPDIWLNDPGVNDPGRAYSYYPKLAPDVAIAPSIMSTNYKQTVPGKPNSPDPTVLQLLDFGRENLRANFMFWARVPAEFNRNNTGVKDTLRSLTQQNSDRVKLRTACPSKYNGCNN